MVTCVKLILALIILFILAYTGTKSPETILRI